MRKIALCFLVIINFVACNTTVNNSEMKKPTNDVSTPNPTVNKDSSSLFKTKDDFVKFWNCIKDVNKDNKTNDAYVDGKINLSKMIPDSEWSSNNPFVQSQTVDADSYIKTGKATGCVK